MNVDLISVEVAYELRIMAVLQTMKTIADPVQKLQYGTYALFWHEIILSLPSV